MGRLQAGPSQAIALYAHSLNEGAQYPPNEVAPVMNPVHLRWNLMEVT